MPPKSADTGRAEAKSAARTTNGSGQDPKQVSVQLPALGIPPELTSLAFSGLAAWLKSGEGFLRGAGKVNAEWARFANRRFQAYSKAWQTAVRSNGDVTNFAVTQSNFIADMTEDYAKEADQMLRILGEASQESIQSAQELAGYYGVPVVQSPESVD